ncbi:MAG: peptidoglycan-associated lipoprotein Pal [Verrucomicrobia bacterium]|nr:peptidoglycan-associated lipoprotein Pal [Verrucomicrobiota bacterium]
MKFSLSRVLLLVTAACLLGGAAGCSRKPKGLTPLPAGQSGSAGPVGEIPLTPGNGVGTGTLGGPGNGTGTDTPGTTGLPNDLDPRNFVQDREKFATDTVYFDFDKSNVKPQYAANIARVADYLKANTSNNLLIEGHCDDRGTEEYNLALGERRALAVRDKLMSLGISGDRVTTISYGKEKPAVVDNTEEAYAKNRRGVFVLLTPPASSR